MVLTPEQEQELLLQNMGLIIHYVDRFCKRRSAEFVLSREDFIQDASVAFINRLRTADTIEEAKNFFMQSLNEMSIDVLRNQPLAVPLRTADMTKTIHSMPTCVSYEKLTYTLPANNQIEDLVENVAFQSFCDELSDIDREIVRLKADGNSIQEIADELGMTYHQVWQHIKKMRNQYLDECN